MAFGPFDPGIGQLSEEPVNAETDRLVHGFPPRCWRLMIPLSISENRPNLDAIALSTRA